MKHKDFIDLASLYVLGALDERDVRLVEDFAETSDELKNDLDRLQIAALAIPYGLKDSEIPARLKERLFQEINSEHPIETPILPSKSESNLFSFQIKSSEIDWQPHPQGIDGVSVSTLFVDEASRKFTGLIRCEAGAIYPSHRHAGEEEIFILEGDLIIDSQSFEVGDYIYSAPNSLHSPIFNQSGCLFLVKTSLDDSFEFLA